MKLKEIFNDALPIVSKFAPSIGAAIGGPVGLATGYAIPILANAFGTHPTDLRGLVTKIINDSDAKTKLEGLEEEHGDWLCSLEDSLNNLAKAEIHINLEWQSDKK
jgi:hypothetical protein